MRVGVDIGGTFTDVVLVDDRVDDRTDRVWIAKVLTTPEAPARAVEAGLTEVVARAGRDLAELDLLSHATTLVTNALIERRGATTALLTTRGFRDVLEIAREHRYDLHDLFLELPAPLVPRELRLEITERLAADGSALVPLDQDQARATIGQLGPMG
ncbi:MAG: hydantoinase/oxoprolinase family protein, partial [Chloroflexi bacterium]|nr:hydantoinase/oxoprolinase family protein [Chloroflexota bacterium]